MRVPLEICEKILFQNILDPSTHNPPSILCTVHPSWSLILHSRPIFWSHILITPSTTRGAVSHHIKYSEQLPLAIRFTGIKPEWKNDIIGLLLSAMKRWESIDLIAGSSLESTEEIEKRFSTIFSGSLRTFSTPREGEEPLLPALKHFRASLTGLHFLKRVSVSSCDRHRIRRSRIRNWFQDQRQHILPNFDWFRGPSRHIDHNSLLDRTWPNLPSLTVMINTTANSPRLVDYFRSYQYLTPDPNEIYFHSNLLHLKLEGTPISQIRLKFTLGRLRNLQSLSVKLIGPWERNRLFSMEDLQTLEITIESISDTPSTGSVKCLLRVCPKLQNLRLYLKRNIDLVTCLESLPPSLTLRNFSITLLPPVRILDYPPDTSICSVLAACISRIPNLVRFELSIIDSTPELDVTSLLPLLVSSSPGVPKLEYISFDRAKLQSQGPAVEPQPQQIGDAVAINKMQVCLPSPPPLRKCDTNLIFRRCKLPPPETLHHAIGHHIEIIIFDT